MQRNFPVLIDRLFPRGCTHALTSHDIADRISARSMRIAIEEYLDHHPDFVKERVSAHIWTYRRVRWSQMAA
jgi:hypothetical protein